MARHVAPTPPPEEEMRGQDLEGARPSTARVRIYWQAADAAAQERREIESEIAGLERRAARLRARADALASLLDALGEVMPAPRDVPARRSRHALDGTRSSTGDATVLGGQAVLGADEPVSRGLDAAAG